MKNDAEVIELYNKLIKFAKYIKNDKDREEFPQWAIVQFISGKRQNQKIKWRFYEYLRETKGDIKLKPITYEAKRRILGGDIPVAHTGKRFEDGEGVFEIELSDPEACNYQTEVGYSFENIDIEDKKEIVNQALVGQDQREIYELKLKGYTQKEIAGLCFLEEHVVSSEFKKIKEKANDLNFNRERRYERVEFLKELNISMEVKSWAINQIIS